MTRASSGRSSGSRRSARRRGFFRISQAPSLREAEREAEAEDERRGPQEPPWSPCPPGLTSARPCGPRSTRPARPRTRTAPSCSARSSPISRTARSIFGAPPPTKRWSRCCGRASRSAAKPIEQYTAAGRPELADDERRRSRCWRSSCLPRWTRRRSGPPCASAIAGGAKDIGKVMGQVLPKFKGRADGKVINQIVREELQAG